MSAEVLQLLASDLSLDLSRPVENPIGNHIGHSARQHERYALCCPCTDSPVAACFPYRATGQKATGQKRVTGNDVEDTRHRAERVENRAPCNIRALAKQGTTNPLADERNPNIGAICRSISYKRTFMSCAVSLMIPPVPRARAYRSPEDAPPHD